MIIIDRLELLPVMLKSIFKTKRRGFALIAGIILATMILTGISLYTTVLKQKNYEGIIGNTAFEVTFDLFNGENWDTLAELGENISNKFDSVKDYTVIGSVHSNDANTWLRATYDATSLVDTTTPMFIDTEQFLTSSISETIFNGKLEGEVDLSGGNKTIIPRSIASKTLLEVGDYLPQINFTHTIFLGDGRTDQVDQMLTNVEVVGIYDTGFEENLGTEFSDTQLFERSNLIFSNDLLNSTLDDLNDYMKRSGNFQLAVKIDESKFTVSDPTLMDEEIDQFINKVSLEFGSNNVVGFNHIKGNLMAFQILSFFLNFLYIVLSIPVIVLSLYVLGYGLDMSLEERRKDIAIKKVQGASKKQIFKELRNETILILLLGITVGYILGILSAYLLGTSNGFLNLAFNGSEFLEYLRFDSNSIIISLSVVGSILIISTYKRGNQFIDEEVSEGVQKYIKQSAGFIRRNKIDIIFMAIGLLGAAMSIYTEVTLNPLPILGLEIYAGIAPFFMWIGGALVGARVAKLVPRKLEGIYLSIFIFKDVARMIKSGLKRRGDVDKLAIIIVLTLSIATLSAVQGVTDQMTDIRTVEYEVGADLQLGFADFGNYSSDILAVEGIEGVLSLQQGGVRILSSNLVIVGLDVDAELAHIKSNRSIANWDDNSFDEPVENALQRIVDQPNGIFLSERSQFRLNLVRGNQTTLNVNLLQPTNENKQASLKDVEVLGTVNSIPGGFGSNTIFTSVKMLNKLTSLSLGLDMDFLNSTIMPSARYLVKTAEGMDITGDDLIHYEEAFVKIEGYSSMASTRVRLDALETGSSGFGIIGLLSLDFIISIFASWVTAFAFSSIIMSRRRREFAVLRAIGAKKSQIYKLALGENGLMMVTTVVWGTMVGILISYGFNSEFADLIGTMFKPTILRRIVVIPWDLIILVDLAILTGMLLATLLSIREAVNADMSIATREE